MRALANLRLLYEAEASFYRAHQRYGELWELGPRGAALISGDLASGTSDGYVYQIAPVANSYAAVAIPSQAQPTTMRFFYCDETGVIRESYGPDPASAKSRAVARVPTY